MRGVIAALVLAVTVPLAASAAGDVPWHSLFPRPRPAGLVPPATDAAVDAAVALALDYATGPSAPGVVTRSPLPLARPARLRARPARAGSGRAPTRASGIESGLCGVRGLQGRRLPRITERNPQCGIEAPVAITAVDGIALSQPATLACDTARTFAQWVEQAMVPAVGRRGGGVVRIRVIGFYACRTRNNRPGARISEHARGRAIDVAGYTLADGTSVSVRHDWRRGPHRRALHRMYAAACGPFATTLSPDSDRHHQDHFHFDLAQYRRGGTYCR